MTVGTKGCPRFCYASLLLKQFLCIFYKTELFWIKLILKKRTSNNYEKRGHHSVQQSLLKLCTKSQGKHASRSGTGARGT